MQAVLINVPELYNYYGFTVKKVGSSLRSNVCPACGENSRKSIKVILSENYWHCFRCGAGGNIYEAIKLIENVDFKEAVDILVVYINFV